MNVHYIYNCSKLFQRWETLFDTVLMAMEITVNMIWCGLKVKLCLCEIFRMD